MSTEDQNLQGGHTPLTPPPAGAAPAASAPGEPLAPAPQVPVPQPPVAYAPPVEPQRSSGATPILIITAVVGAIALAGSGGAAALASVGDFSRSDSAQSLGVDGIDSLDLEVGASDVTVRFGDVEEAELSVIDGRGGNWTLERDDDELVVRSPESAFGWWFGGWFGDDETVVLTLPESLSTARIDADVTLNAGSLDMSGDFGELDIEVGAGGLFLEGSARSLDAEVSAGRAEILLEGVRTSTMEVSAGRLVAELTGTAPDEVVIDVSAGSLELTVPDVAYDVRQDVSAGSLTSDVDESSQSSRTIAVTVSAGSVTVSPED